MRKRASVTHFVIVTPHNMYIRRDRPQILVRFAVTNIPRTQNLLDLAWHKEFLKLRRKVVNSVGDVKVAYDKDKNHGESKWQSSARRSSTESVGAARTQTE